MHGIVFNQLSRFVRENFGTEVLKEALAEAGLKNKFFASNKAYPDEEIEAIVAALCTKLNIDRNSALEAFGEFLAPGLLQIYGAFVKSEWKAMDLLENIEGTIHKAVRLGNPGALPPSLKIERTDENTVVINYNSPRKMIHLGVGIIRAIAKHYNEDLHISQSKNEEYDILEITK